MVFSAGQVLTAAQLNDVTQSAVSSYVPTVANGGTVTWTTRTGWYYTFGAAHMVFFACYLVVNVAGSGTTQITVTAPTNIDRTTRQVIGGHMEIPSGSVNTNLGPMSAVAFAAGEGGTGAIIDRLRGETAAGSLNIRGVDLVAAAIITLTGCYRAA
jgi:hypothetical protein